MRRMFYNMNIQVYQYLSLQLKVVIIMKRNTIVKFFKFIYVE